MKPANIIALIPLFFTLSMNAMKNFKLYIANPHFSILESKKIISNIPFLSFRTRALQEYVIDQSAQHPHYEEKYGEILNELIKKESSLVSHLNFATPLHSAVKNLAKHLISHDNYGVHERKSNGNTPLHCITSHVKTAEIITMLMNNGAKINAQNWNHDTPLHCAPASTVPLLLKYGADLALKNKTRFKTATITEDSSIFFPICAFYSRKFDVAIY